MQNLKVVFLVPAVFLACSFANSESKILQTGQEKSYAPYDDGYYKKGVKRSFTRDDKNEIVTDNVTGLMWQNNSDIKGKTEQYDQKKRYCEELKLGGFDDWRLPSVDELSSLVVYNSSTNKKKMSPVFKNIAIKGAEALYWSSERISYDKNFIWGMVFVSLAPVTSNAVESNFKANSICVRNGDVKKSSTCVRNSDETVSCKESGLMWQDNGDVVSIGKTWEDAIGYCENLTLGNHSDWRMPNINELRSIIEYKKKNKKDVDRYFYDLPDFYEYVYKGDKRAIKAAKIYDKVITSKIKDGFKYARPAVYWSSTTFEKQSKRAWTGLFNYGSQDVWSKNTLALIRCVRSN